MCRETNDKCRIFDSNAHPTLTGRWPTKNRDASFGLLSKYINREEVIGACAVGLWNIESYNHISYANSCKIHDKMVPIAGFAPKNNSSIKEELTKLKELGFKGIKIHSRSCNSDLILDKNQFIETFKCAAELDLIVMYCSFLSIEIGQFPSSDPYWDLIEILKECQETKVIIVHGGATRLLLYAELVRFNPNLLLDLSFTIMKYRNSSIDSDIKFLFSTLDQRLCLGSDFPEYSIKDVRDNALRLADGLPVDKIENIFFKNIMNLLDLNYD
jgi:predicted TIM-barrel fold metal-dependent hydrolase